MSLISLQNKFEKKKWIHFKKKKELTSNSTFWCDNSFVSKIDWDDSGVASASESVGALLSSPLLRP